MSDKIFNLYGDRLVSTTGTHGVDIASQRIDDLDKAALQQILLLPEAQRATCIDLGCGFGWQGIRFALLGASAFLFDLLPESILLRILRENTSLFLSHRAEDLRHLNADDLPTSIDLGFSQRFIHYLTYAEAERLINVIGSRMPAHSFFYISASGLHSELGRGYVDLNTNLRSRFSLLSPDMQSKHDIREPVCLYTENDLKELMAANNFEVQRTWLSAFGNVKGVFYKSN